ncbi:hypothetical protein [Martelella sp. AMO21009]
MKKMTIQQLLTWAFTEELCKTEATGGRISPRLSSANAGLNAAGELGTIIARTPNEWGVVPTWEDGVAPDPDALIVGDAVKALTGTGFDIPEGWQPFPEWANDEHGLIAGEVDRVLAEERQHGVRRTGSHAFSLLVTCAVLKRGPDWYAERPKVRMVERQGKPVWFITKRQKDSFGRWHEVETDGYDRKAKRPKRGAYRKYVLSHGLRGEIQSRIDWIVWQAALQMLERELAGRLGEKQITPMRFDMSPWMREVRA